MLPWRAAVEARHDPPPRIDGVDDRVDLQRGGHADGFAALVHAADEFVEEGLLLVGVGFGFQLLAVAEAHGAFEAHAAELAGGPAGDEDRRVEAAAGHGLGAEAIALAQHHHEQRHAELGAGDELARDAAHGGGVFAVGADHEAGGVA
jgi:hypothetical protein